ncbi:endonuclease/exonuclease/phosphatase family protein [Thalassoglobus sp. JC818]|uniref:endonuclease/exonuclease/phosphatase family protein n=1 Tax=Thalassoglobus sp. JC818 TaxID=3232136 RepID=UPI0034588437
MSFNIRYGTANDGDHVWDNRKEFVVETIEAFAPDLLGTQETLKFQKDYLHEHLSEYHVIGVGRDDGQEAGEMMAVYIRKSRFEILDSGHFWYSETPNEPGSKAWDTSLPRMATWVKLSDRAQDGRTIWFFNTHFDHRGSEARRESASLLRRMVSQLAGKDPAIITGDFNAPEGSDVYNNLFEGETPIPLTDTYRSFHSDSDENAGTSGGFTLKDRGTRRIDWIGCSKQFSVLSAEIDRTNRDGVTPSDHFPVTAVLQLK